MVLSTTIPAALGKIVNFGPLTTEFTLTRHKSTLHVLRILMHLRSTHVTNVKHLNFSPTRPGASDLFNKMLACRTCLLHHYALAYQHYNSLYVYEYYTTLWAIKNVALYFCPRLRQLLTDFQNSFTGTLCGQLATM